jgi:hypothetical protein
MIEPDTVRRIALSLPEAEDRSSGSALDFQVRGKRFAWSWLERVGEKGPRQPRLDVLAVRCAAEEKESILASDARKFFTTDHYRGFPAVLVRLDEVDECELRGLLRAAWRCQAPRSLAKRLERP